MKHLVLFVAIACNGQTIINGGRTFLGPVDASSATITKPIRSVAADPPTCSFPEFYANSTDGLPRRCKLSPPNTWEIIGSGGGGSTTGLYAAALNFSTAIPPGGCDSRTLTATGITTGRTLALGLPSGLAATLQPRAVVTAADVVTVQLCNGGDVEETPGSATYSVRDTDALGYLTGSATIDWGALVPGQCSTNTITVAGAAAGDNVAAGWPSGLNAGLATRMLVTAPDTVTAQLCNVIDAEIDVTSLSYKAAITR